MSKLSEDLIASSNKIETIFLQRFAEVTQTRVALDLDVRDDVICKFRKEKLKFVCDVLASLGLKVVPDDSVEVCQAEIDALKTLAAKYFLADEIRRKKATK